MIRVLLLGCGGNAGRNWVKCIKMGDPDALVVGVDTNAFHLAMSNVDIKVNLPQLTDADKFQKVLELSKEYNINYWHAQPDKEVRFLAKYGFSSIPVNLDMWYRFYNKSLCQKIWGRDGRFLIEDYITISEEKFKEIVSRSGRAWIRAAFGAGSRAALPIRDLNEADAWVSYWHGKISPSDFIISEFLPGKEYAVQMYLDEGSVVHAGMRQRVEYFFGNQMPSGQSSTPSVAKSVLEVRLLEEAISSIVHIDPELTNGLYCIDMKENYLGELIPTEINYGRFFTTSDFMASIGLNTPYELAKSYITQERMRAKIAPPGYYWLRGLDTEPYLIHEDELWSRSD